MYGHFHHESDTNVATAWSHALKNLFEELLDINIMINQTFVTKKERRKGKRLNKRKVNNTSNAVCIFIRNHPND